jgi:hypothetical protein
MENNAEKRLESILDYCNNLCEACMDCAKSECNIWVIKQFVKGNKIYYCYDCDEAVSGLSDEGRCEECQTLFDT